MKRRRDPAVVGTRKLGLLLSMVLVASVISGCERPGNGERPHIIVVSADTLRADHLSLNGYERKTSPHLEEFARVATQFKQTVSVVAKTGPSFVTTFSGTHPIVHGVRDNPYAIPEQVELLPEVLRGSGYRTGAFVSNPVLVPDRGYDRGFETYRMLLQKRMKKEDRARRLEKLNELFFDWVRGGWERPTFAWIHYIDPHGKYDPPEAYRGAFDAERIAEGDGERVPLEYEPLEGFNQNYVLGAVPKYQQLGREDRRAVYVQRYDEEIRYVDQMFGEVVEFLRGEGVFEDAVVIFLADHGEILGEHDYYFEHGWFAYEPGLRVPLLIKRPGQEEGQEVHESVSLGDVGRTVLRLARVSDRGFGCGGQDLFSDDFREQTVVVMNGSTYPERFIGVRTSGWKYLRKYEKSGKVKDPTQLVAEELYDLRTDPEEVRNRVGQDPAQLTGMRNAFGERWKDLGKCVQRQAEEEEVSEEVQEELESLGYVQ